MRTLHVGASERIWTLMMSVGVDVRDVWPRTGPGNVANWLGAGRHWGQVGVKTFLGEDMTSDDKVEKMKNSVVTLAVSLPFSFSSLAALQKQVLSPLAGARAMVDTLRNPFSVLRDQVASVDHAVHE